MNDLTAVKIGGDDLLIGDVSESDDYAVIGPGTEGVDVLHKTMLKYVDLHSRVVLIEIHKLADRYEKESSNKASFGSAFSKISSCSTLSDAISVAEKNWLTYFQKDGENEFAL